MADKKTRPLVSICTPTFNRRPFFKAAIECFKHQDYPLERMEWIIIDDGTDKIEDIIKEANIPQIKYYAYDEKMTLGKKRNLMHTKTTGDIIVYMDDDDYYPPQRVSHAVEMLEAYPEKLVAGSTIIHVYFKHIEKIVEFGPYGPNHATAATFAFRRALLDQTSYNEAVSMGEERDFLKAHTIPMVQLEAQKTILVFSHSHNSFDKKELLTTANKSWKQIDVPVGDFVKEDALKEFYLNTIETLLRDYEPGEVKHKPDVIENLRKIKEEQSKMTELMNSMQNKICMNMNGKPVVLETKEMIELLNKLVTENHTLKGQMQQVSQMYPPVRVPIMGKGIHGVPSKYAEAFIQNTLNRASLYEKILQEKNLLPEESSMPQMPSLLDIMPELAQLNQPSKQSNFQFQQPSSNTEGANEDIDTIMQQTECSRDIALKFYQENNKDIVDSIMKIFELKESGDYDKLAEELASTSANKASETDVDLVIQQTECSKERAQKALCDNKQDIVESIMEITNEQDAAKSGAAKSDTDATSTECEASASVSASV